MRRAKGQPVGRDTPMPWIRAEVERFGSYLRAESRSENTVDQYTKVLRWFLEWFGKAPEHLTEDDMQTWKGHLSVEKGYCENSMSKMIAAVNQYTERILKRPDLKMRPPKKVIRTKIPLTEEEVHRILEEAKRPRRGRNGFPNNADASLRDHAAICIMYYGGLRADEVGKLRISGLDLDNRKIRVHEGKGKDFSIVNLTPEAVSSIHEYLRKGRSKPQKPEYADVLFLTVRGRPFGRNVLWAQVKRIAFWAGIEKNVHPHIFRHSMITHMAEKGIPAQMIQAQSRHKSLDMVQHYTHLSAKTVRDAYDLAFAKKLPAEKTSPPQTEERAQEPRPAPANTLSTRDRLLELVLDGKLTEDKIGRLEKLITMMDGPKDKAPHFEGYA